MSIAEVRNEIVKFATYARASESNGVTIGAGTLEYWADKLGAGDPVSLQPSVEKTVAEMQAEGATIGYLPGPWPMQTKQACENCLYTGKPCPECLPEWERANREV